MVLADLSVDVCGVHFRNSSIRAFFSHAQIDCPYAANEVEAAWGDAVMKTLPLEYARVYPRLRLKTHWLKDQAE